MGRMSISVKKAKTDLRVVIGIAIGFTLATTALIVRPGIANATGQAAAPVKSPSAMGTIKSIGTGMIVLTNETGVETKVIVGTDVKFLRVPPGSKDLKEATPIQISDLAVGDRILVRGKPGEESGTFVASSVISMKKEDLAAKQAREREEWQRHGIGGMVKSVDPAAGVVTVGTLGVAGKKDVEVHVSNSTIVRRYAPGSVKFDDAKTSSLAEIHAGDQLRARGAKTEDGGSLTADEVVAGSFRNIAGTISAVDASKGTITVTDLANNKQVEVKITPESQVRKLPAPMAQRIAARLKGTPADEAATTAAGGAPPTGGRPAGQPTTAGGMQGAGGTGRPGGMTGGGAVGGGGDLQQMLSRLPATPLSEFQKGDAVVIVATSQVNDSKVVAITLLGGVEPILQASSQGQAASILSPWSLSNGGADTGTP